MADQFPDEGLNFMLAIIPKNGTNLANLFVGLYNAQGATSVPAAGINLTQLAGAGNAGFYEVSTTLWSEYARVTEAAGSWGPTQGSTIWSTGGRAVQGSQVQFRAPSGSYSPAFAINGFFLATLITYNQGTALYYSNFEDGSSIPSLSANDIVKISPGFGLGN